MLEGVKHLLCEGRNGELEKRSLRGDVSGDCYGKELHELLEEEERRLLRRLQDEERQLLQRLQDSLARLGERRRRLRALAAELEEKSLQPGPEMLQDIKDTLAR
ncbi:hypothetical protein AV530_010101 [Patagioenas fasciata monilis]|nr:hypothetical protein AV530_010101 [Patagioenas fasciata monilis]